MSPQRSPLLRMASGVLLLAILGASLFLGLALFVVLLAGAIVLAAIIYMRFWWIRRQWQRNHADRHVTLEGEYKVKEERPRRHD